jgi:hypothetical protein
MAKPAEERFSPEDQALLEAMAVRVVRMGLATPAVFFLESVKPLSFLGSQALVFFEPIVRAIFHVAQYERFARLMEDREAVERLLERIEALDAEARDREAEIKKKARAERAAARAARAAARAARRTSRPGEG